MVVDTLISLGIMSILVYIALKAEIINHNSDMILDLLMGWRRPPPPPSSLTSVGSDT